jgi:PAS domain S-box-containing protein
MAVLMDDTPLVERPASGWRPAWLPIPIAVLLIALLRRVDTGVTFEPPLLLPVLNTVFLVAIPLLVAWRASRSYPGHGAPAVLLMAWGSLGLGLSNASASLLAVLSTPDAMVTLHNTGALIAGLCYAASAVLSVRPEAVALVAPAADEDRSPFVVSRRASVFALGVSTMVLLLGLLTAAKLHGLWRDAFFGPAGPTTLRQVVLGGAVVSFGAAALLFRVTDWSGESRFVRWYSLALLLIAVGLGGVFVQNQVGSLTGWVGRAAQYLGCAYLYLAIRAVPLDSEVLPLGQVLRETHDRYRRLLETAPVAILVHAEGKYTFANEAAAFLFGAPSPEALVGREVLDLVAPEDRRTVRERIASVRQGGPTPLRALRILRLDGSPVDVETSAARVEYSGRPAVQVVIRDISRRLRLEAQLREQADRLAEANRLKDEFLATLSHELRTPLNAILGWSRMLVAGALHGDAVRRAIEAIDRNASMQVHLINDVLDVSRIVSGKLRLEAGPTDVGGCMQAALLAVRPALEAKQIEVEEDIRSGLVLGDPERLQQVFWNLLSNAAKFTGQGGRVTACVREDGDQVHAEVRDSGVGIAPDFLPHVFERFRQADGSTTRAHGGLGLGLAIARHLVELHGGRVWAESDGPGQGAAFHVVLPARQIAQGAATDDPASGGLQPVPCLAGMQVLVVDDEQDARDLLQAMLVSYGAEVRVAESAARGLELVESWRPTVLLTDIGMPGTDGYQLLRDVRALGADRGGATPALAVTAYGRGDDRERTSKAGFAGHLTKPVSPVVVASLVEQIGRGDASASPRV